MAKFLSNQWAVISGSINGTVYSKNRVSSYTRNRTKPTNPQSTTQSIIRTLLAGISSSWRALSDDQRSQWNAAAQNYSFANGVEGFYIPTGFQLYQMQNQNSSILDNALITLPLPVAGSITLTGNVNNTVDRAAATFITNVNNNGLASQRSKIYMTGLVDKSVALPTIKNQLRLLRDPSNNNPVFASDGGINSLDTGQDFAAAYTSMFGVALPTIPNSKTIWVKVVFIKSDYTDMPPVFIKSTMI